MEILRDKLSEKNVLDDVISIDYHKVWEKIKSNILNYEEFKSLISKKDTLYISRTSDLKEDEMDVDVCSLE